MQVDLGEARNCTEKNILDAWLHGRGDGNGIAVAAKSGCHPYNVNIGNG
jgi:hypothetical protein